MTLQSNGKIIVAGSSDQGNTSVALARYNSDGSLDTTFNGTGKVTTAIAAGALAASVAVQGDGKIVAAGQSTTGSNQDFTVVRYLGDTSPAVIVAQPQSQALTAGSNVTISVSATGIPAPSYQWKFNGMNISGATASSLALTNVQQAQAGSYSVVVTNASAQVTSAAAKLSLVQDLGTVAPAQPTYMAVTPEAGKDSVVFITHGRTPSPTDWPDQVAWLTTMKNTIQANIPSNWWVLEYEWEKDSEPGISTDVAYDVATVIGYAKGQGRSVARQLIDIAQLFTPNGRLEHVHFIGHSAGCALINEAARVFTATFPQIPIHTTFLDPYFGVTDGGRALYGAYSTWSDSYFSYSPDSLDAIYPWTYGSMANAHNVDVT